MRAETMKARKASVVVATAAAAGLLLSACANQSYRDGRYYRDGGGYSQVCQSCGTVQDVQQVYVKSNGDGRGLLGAVIGAVAGGVLGSTIGKGDGRSAATIVGAAAGGVVGNRVGANSGGGQDLAFRVTMRLDNGQYATVTQREDPGLRPGDYAVIRGDRVYRR